MSLVAEIEARMQSLQPSVCVCEDESHHHIGHYALLIVSEAFVGVNRVARQRMVNALVQDLFPAQIHALSIKALSPQEWSESQQKDFA